MTILLTGGSGFIGHNISESLAGKYNILSPSSRDLNLTDTIAVNDFFRSNCIDLVIHCAVRPGHRNAMDASNQLFINTRMYFNIIRNAHRFGRLIFIGSGAVYDVRQPLTKITENSFDLSVPSDEHGFSKYIINKHIEKTDNSVDLRVFGVFGAYEDYAIRFISNAICKTLFDLPITIRQNRMFDYLFVDDLMPILDYFIHNEPKYRAYNVTPDSAVDLVSIAEMVRARSGKALPIIVGEPGMGLEYSGDNARLRSEIPTVTFTPLHEAIDRLYCWYESNKNLIDQRLLQVDR